MLFSFKNPPPPPPVLSAKTVTPSKSFKESIKEKASEVSHRTGLQYSKHSPVKSVPAKCVGSPSRVASHSPSKVCWQVDIFWTVHESFSVNMRFFFFFFFFGGGGGGGKLYWISHAKE